MSLLAGECQAVLHSPKFFRARAGANPTEISLWSDPSHVLEIGQSSSEPVLRRIHDSKPDIRSRENRDELKSQHGRRWPLPANSRTESAIRPWTICALRLLGYRAQRRRERSRATPKLCACIADWICFSNGSLIAGSTSFCGGGSLLISRSIDSSAARAEQMENTSRKQIQGNCFMPAFNAGESEFNKNLNACRDRHRLLQRSMLTGAILRPLAALAFVFLTQSSPASSCVWKVTGPNGGLLFLGGSIHALRPSDYPLPVAYEHALDASARLVLEDDPKASPEASKELFKAGQYAKGDSLKNHVDPRTYEYLRRFFALINLPEQKFTRFKPWFINLMLSYPSAQYLNLGVEEFLIHRATKTSKPVSGLEEVKEHNLIFEGLSDRESEALLLILFVNAAQGNSAGVNVVDAWRHGPGGHRVAFIS